MADLTSRRGQEVDTGTLGWGPVPTHVWPAGEPEGEPIALRWPAERGRGLLLGLLLAPWLLAPPAAVVVVYGLDLDIDGKAWLLVAGVMLALISTLLATITMLAAATSWLRDRLAPEQVEGVVVLLATARSRGSDGGAEQLGHYLAVDDGTRPVPVYHSSSWVNSRIRTGEPARLVIGPRRQRVLRVVS